MMTTQKIPFYKYDATGNDFILIDQRNAILHHWSKEDWARLCRRRLGVGADGVILLKNPLRHHEAQIAMAIINADGGEVEMCGNGLRALAAFAKELGLMPAEGNLAIETLAGLYSARFAPTQEWSVHMIEPRDVGKINVGDLWPEIKGRSIYMDTGVPHVVLEHMNIDSLDIMRLAPSIRFEQRFNKGTNVNWLQIVNETTIKVRTFERGVEAETLSCGTGVTACAQAYWRWAKHERPLTVQTPGGTLTLEKNKTGAIMTGPVRLVYRGEFNSEMFTTRA